MLSSTQVKILVPDNDRSENIALPGPSVVTEETKLEGLSDDVVVGSVELEELKGSPAEMGNHVDVSQDCRIVPEIESENLNQPPLPSTSDGDNVLGSSEMELVGSSSEKLDQPPPSSTTEDDNVTGSSEVELVAIVPQESESKDEAATAHHVSESQPECENKDLHPSSSVQEGENAKGSSERDLSMDHASLPESENMDLPLSSSAQEGEKVEGSSGVPNSATQ